MAYFAFRKSYQGKKIARIRETQSDTVAGVTGSNYETFYRYPASFSIPYDDPQFNKEGNTANGVYGYMLNSRTWIYDIGLSLITFTISGDNDLAEEMLNRLEIDQNDDGSWNFSYDIYVGELFHSYVRSGAIGWLGWGMCYHMIKTNNKSWINMAKKGADYIISRQVMNGADLRYGLVRGGSGSYDSNYNFDPSEIEWCSIEHNCSCLQYLWGIYRLTGEDKYRKSAMLIERSLRTTAWDRDNDRFYQGVNSDGVDDAWALDATTWVGTAALSFLSVRNCEAFANTADTVYGTSDNILKDSTSNHYNMTYELLTPVDGHKPYSDRTSDYAGAPDIVWTEGTLGYVGLLLKLGMFSEAYHYIDEMIKIQDVSVEGGLVYVTETWADLPWEFHVWESVVSSCWLYIVLNDPNAIWPLHTRQAFDLELSKDRKAFNPVGSGRITQVNG